MTNFEDLSVAKLQAATKFPYLKELILEMPVVIVDHPALSTAAISDRMVLYVSRQIVDEDILLLPYVIARDIFHLILRHAKRYEQFTICSPAVWTVAARMAIFSFMRQMPGSLYADFAERFLIDPNHYGLPLYLTAEEYAELLTSKDLPPVMQQQLQQMTNLVQQLQSRGQSQSAPTDSSSQPSKDEVNRLPAYQSGSCVHGQKQPWETGEKDSHAPPEPTLATMIDTVKEAIAHMQRGISHGNVLRELEEYGHTAGIRHLLKLLTEAHRTAHKSGGSNLDITKVRRRQYLEQYRHGYVLPPFTKNHVRVGILVDTSGSMELETELRMCIQCVNSFLASGEYNEVMFYSGDTDVSNTQKLCRGQKPILIGDGGTDVGKMIAQIEEMNRGKPLDYLVVFTDGWTPWGNEPETMKVIAVITKPDHWSIPEWVQYITIDELFPHLRRRTSRGNV